MNKLSYFGLLVSGFLLMLISSCSEDARTPQESNVQKIAKVTDVQLSILESNPLQLNITATGNVTSSGWFKPELLPLVYVATPQDGIYDFEFLAFPPSGSDAAVITSIKTTSRLSPLPDSLKGVRIHASQNEIEATLESKEGSQ